MRNVTKLVALDMGALTPARINTAGGHIWLLF